MDSYLEAMDKVSEAMAFLAKNKNFKSADKGLAELVFSFQNHILILFRKRYDKQHSTNANRYLVIM